MTPRLKAIIVVLLYFTSSMSLGVEKVNGLNVQYITTLKGERLCVAAKDDVDSILSWEFTDENSSSNNFDNNDEENKAVFEPKINALRNNASVESLLLDCRFNDLSPCTFDWNKHPWIVKSSLDFNYGLVLDRHWDEFPVVKSEFAEFSDPIKFENANFEIPISIRTSKGLYIKICNRNTTQASSRATTATIKNSDELVESEINCYRLIISGWNGTKSLMKKYNGTNWIDIHIKHHKEAVFAQEEWRHFILKYSADLNVVNFNEMNDNEKIFEWQLPPQKNNANKIDHNNAGKKKKSVYLALTLKGKYKIHSYNILHTKEVGKQNLGNLDLYKNEEKEICISFSLRMCELCKFKVQIYANNFYNLYENTFDFDFNSNLSSSFSGWREIKIFVKNPAKYKGQNKMLYIETISSSTEPFWSIREVRSCSQKEWRVLKYEKDEEKNSRCVVTKMTSSSTYYNYKFEENGDGDFTKHLLLPKIDSFEDYNNTENFVSLRWKETPPTLNASLSFNSKYTVKCCNHTLCLTAKKIERCKIWSDFYCTTFNNLNKNDDYKVSIVPFKDGIDGFITPNITLNVILNSSGSTPPLNLTASFNEDNTLLISWKHPKRMNGALKYYHLEVLRFINGKFRVFIDKKLFGDFEHENLSSLIKLPENEWTFYKGKHILSLKAVNDNGESDPTQLEIWVPPEIPTFNNDRIEISNISETTAVINIPKAHKIDEKQSHLFVVIAKYENNKESVSLKNEKEIISVNATLKEKCKITDEDAITKFTWTAYDGKYIKFPKNFLIGNLTNGTRYYVCALLMNELNNYTRFSMESVKFVTNNYWISENAKEVTSLYSTSNMLYASLAIILGLIFLIVTVIIVYLKKTRKEQIYIPPNPDFILSPNMQIPMEDRYTGYLTPRANYADNIYEEINYEPVEYNVLDRRRKEDLALKKEKTVPLDEEEVSLRKNYVTFNVRNSNLDNGNLNCNQ